ncbi:thiamine diphosphokinase [Tabrizicola sp. J26]|uniref:thiamine diphosphokinase n=1 Tax=Alitabrizicola rongguiensis TaxID=2909234 RepID=UPI001F28AC9D|nr:thiamine diphosphokinase [Tabrizicola rongguiensis]MCF1709041.1 thiamine diphosphokinase [Tabrizicola rongguiensis]
MTALIVDTTDGITLVGGAPFAARTLEMALKRAPVLVAADGGADRALSAGRMPQAVVGDFDSISDTARQAIPAERQFPIAEQETTDFDKALRSTRSPFVLALGFVGARVDHGLAVFSTLARHPDRTCLVIGGQDVVFLCPRGIRLRLEPGDRFSLFPLGEVSGQSTGLRWPIDGLAFAPHGIIGTSNEVSAPDVTLELDAPRMLAILPRRRLDRVLSALLPQWRLPRADGGR